LAGGAKKNFGWNDKKQTLFFSETRHFFCFFLKTFKIKISTVWQSRDLPESPKTLFRHVTSPSLKEKAKIKRKEWKEAWWSRCGFFFFFFFFSPLPLPLFKIQFATSSTACPNELSRLLELWNRNHCFGTSKRTKDQ